MTRLICTEIDDFHDLHGQRLYMYAPNNWSANPFVAIQFHVEGAARQFGDMCRCHEGDYIWDADSEKVVFRWGKDENRDGGVK